MVSRGGRKCLLPPMILLIIPFILYADLKHNQHSCAVIFINLRSKEDIFCTNYHPLQSHFSLWFLYCCVLLKATLCLYSLFFFLFLKKVVSLIILYLHQSVYISSHTEKAPTISFDSKVVDIIIIEEQSLLKLKFDDRHSYKFFI